jgi:quercetin dioxygenase-like cupin family protein
MPPGGRHEIHRHPHAEEVEYLVAGEALARVDDVDVRMRPGDVIFVHANEMHGLWNTSQTEPAVVVWCYGGAASLEEAGYVHEPAANWTTTPIAGDES